MAVLPGRVSVATSATRLDVGTAAGWQAGALLVVNAGAASVDLGPAGVTSGAGLELAPGASVTVEIRASDGGLYGIAASGTVRCDVLQVGS